MRPCASTRIRPSVELAAPTFVAVRAELDDAEATLSPNVSDNAAATAPIERTKPFISCSFRMRFAIAVAIAAVDQEGLRRAAVIPDVLCRSDPSGQKQPMSVVEIDRATGALVVEGRAAFPLILSDGPPLGAKAPDGADALAELAAGGASFIRTGRAVWSPESIEQQIAAEREVLDAAAAHGLHCWLRLGNVPDLSARGLAAKDRLLTRIVEELKDHPALGAWKGIDEPANPSRPARVPAAGLVRAHQKLRETDPSHPVVITQAPVGTAAQLVPYRPAFDITGADIYPVSYPPGKHAAAATGTSGSSAASPARW